MRLRLFFFLRAHQLNKKQTKINYIAEAVTLMLMPLIKKKNSTMKWIDLPRQNNNLLIG